MPVDDTQAYREHIERGQFTIGGQRLGYQLYEIDARPIEPAPQATLAGSSHSNSNHLPGNLNVFIPGHWQKAHTARALLRWIAADSDSHLVWSFDIDPPQGGDPVRAAALVELLHQRIASRISHSHDPQTGQPEPTRVTLYGWSHGGAEALRTVELAPDLFKHLVLYCPAGLVERRPKELAWSFLLEGLRVFTRSLGKSWARVGIVLRILFEILAGLASDLFRARSFRRLIDDIGWICQKVPGADYRFKGQVVILFAENDTVIRWRDVFPAAKAEPGEGVTDVSTMPGVDFADFQSDNFPYAKKVVVRLLPGDHASPETEPEYYSRVALELLTD